MSDDFAQPYDPRSSAMVQYLMSINPELAESIAPMLGNLSQGMVAGLAPDASKLGTTGATNYIQDALSLNFDDALAAYAGPGAYSQGAFDPVTTGNVVETPGRRRLQQAMQQGTSIDSIIARHLFEGGTATDAFADINRKIQDALTAGGNATPEQQQLLAQIPPSNNQNAIPGEISSYDLSGVMNLARDMEEGAMSDPSEGPFAPVVAPDGTVISPGGERRWVDDGNGGEVLIEYSSEPSEVAQQYIDQGLSLPTDQYTPEGLLGQDWQDQAAALSGSRDVQNAASEMMRMNQQDPMLAARQSEMNEIPYSGPTNNAMRGEGGGGGSGGGWDSMWSGIGDNLSNFQDRLTETPIAGTNAMPPMVNAAVTAAQLAPDVGSWWARNGATPQEAVTGIAGGLGGFINDVWNSYAGNDQSFGRQWGNEQFDAEGNPVQWDPNAPYETAFNDRVAQMLADRGATAPPQGQDPTGLISDESWAASQARPPLDWGPEPGVQDQNGNTVPAGASGGGQYGFQMPEQGMLQQILQNSQLLGVPGGQIPLPPEPPPGGVPDWTQAIPSQMYPQTPQGRFPAGETLPALNTDDLAAVFNRPQDSGLPQLPQGAITTPPDNGGYGRNGTPPSTTAAGMVTTPNQQQQLRIMGQQPQQMWFPTGAPGSPETGPPVAPGPSGPSGASPGVTYQGPLQPNIDLLTQIMGQQRAPTTGRLDQAPPGDTVSPEDLAYFLTGEPVQRNTNSQTAYPAGGAWADNTLRGPGNVTSRTEPDRRNEQQLMQVLSGNLPGSNRPQLDQRAGLGPAPQGPPPFDTVSPEDLASFLASGRRDNTTPTSRVERRSGGGSGTSASRATSQALWDTLFNQSQQQQQQQYQGSPQLVSGAANQPDRGGSGSFVPGTGRSSAPQELLDYNRGVGERAGQARRSAQPNLGYRQEDVDRWKAAVETNKRERSYYGAEYGRAAGLAWMMQRAGIRPLDRQLAARGAVASGMGLRPS